MAVFHARLPERHDRNSGTDKINVLLEKYRGKPKQVKDVDVLRPLFGSAVREYDHDADPYRTFFDMEALQEYQDHDPDSFKGALKRECPIIRVVLNSRREELKEWQYKFTKLTRGQELLDIFGNLLEFAQDYAQSHEEPSFGTLDDFDSFGLEHLDDEPEYRIEGVIGSGIKSCVLHHLFPRCFPQLNRRSMYGLYFLSRMGHFGLESGTSEFLMIHDEFKSDNRNIRMDHNYWYPYGLLTLYAMRQYRLIASRSESIKLSLDSNYRFVYVDCLFGEVWKQHEEHIGTMMCVDERDM
jgi:hypothetical protein